MFGEMYIYIYTCIHIMLDIELISRFQGLCRSQVSGCRASA